jgi:hypothetical protein
MDARAMNDHDGGGRTMLLCAEMLWKILILEEKSVVEVFWIWCQR